MATNPNPDGESSGPLRPDDLLQYQPGAIVSRMLIKKPSGTVTAFAAADFNPLRPSATSR